MARTANDAWMARCNGTEPMTAAEHQQDIRERAEIGNSFAGRDVLFVFEAIDAVLALHRRMTFSPYCVTCNLVYPCSTRRAVLRLP